MYIATQIIPMTTASHRSGTAVRACARSMVLTRSAFDGSHTDGSHALGTPRRLRSIRSTRSSRLVSIELADTAGLRREAARRRAQGVAPALEVRAGPVMHMMLLAGPRTERRVVVSSRREEHHLLPRTPHSSTDTFLSDTH